MDKIFVSLDGANSTGKTYLLNTIVRHNSLYYGIGLGENQKIADENWWFYKSMPVELMEELLVMVQERAVKCRQIKQPVIFLDKGLRTLQSRLYSTFKIRGVSQQRIEEYIEHFTIKYCEIVKENLFVLLDNQFVTFDQKFFAKYNRVQREYLKKFVFDVTHEMKNDKDYPGSAVIDKMEQAILEYLKNKWLEEISGRKYMITALTGFQDNETDFLIQYLRKKKAVWCIDYAYMKEQVQKKFGIFQENTLFQELLFHELADYLKQNNNCHVILKNPEGNFCTEAGAILGGQFNCINKSLMNFQVEKSCGKNIGLYQVCDIMEQKSQEPYEYAKLERKALYDLCIDSCFRNIIIDIEEKVRESAGENLALFSVVGSCAFESAIKNWSDIDVFVILKQQDHKFQHFINQIPKNYSIHIGISCFTVLQIEIGEVDIKGQWNLYYIQNKIIAPSYIDSSLCTRRMNLNELIEIEKYRSNEFKYMMNRMIYSDMFSTRKLVKLTLDYVKVTLHKYNIVVNRKQNILEALLVMWGIDYGLYFNSNRIQDISISAAQNFAVKVLEKVY
ncbi:hypothetical protein [Clostridium sp. E02]|uniref:hypothetical protein n=1 Tax=Clostridium sp. E02 TaxID=2487134 RepID=UPI000F523FFC|nr:hypothetical protein [Clostridium sp. E02]